MLQSFMCLNKTMNSILEWNSGHNNYRKHTYIINQDTKKHNYLLEIVDQEITEQDRSIFDIFADYLSIRQTKTVEILYSGGVDSELVLYGCLLKKIPVRALTMRLIINGIVKNTHDLYYSEKFCRHHNIEQKFVDMDVMKFYTNGDHVKYLEPYLITRSNLATQIWLLEQASGFPVIGGEYLWPWAHLDKMKLSPIRNMFHAHDRFLKDRGISGIGSLLDYGYESAVKLMLAHIEVVKSDKSKFLNLNITSHSLLKHLMFKKLGFETIELRRRSHGWEYMDLDREEFNRRLYDTHLIAKYGVTADKIKWNTELAKFLNNEPGENDTFR